MWREWSRDKKAFAVVMAAVFVLGGGCTAAAAVDRANHPPAPPPCCTDERSLSPFLQAVHRNVIVGHVVFGNLFPGAGFVSDGDAFAESTAQQVCSRIDQAVKAGVKLDDAERDAADWLSDKTRGVYVFTDIATHYYCPQYFTGVWDGSEGP